MCAKSNSSNKKSIPEKKTGEATPAKVRIAIFDPETETGNFSTHLVPSEPRAEFGAEVARLMATPNYYTCNGSNVGTMRMLQAASVPDDCKSSTWKLDDGRVTALSHRVGWEEPAGNVTDDDVELLRAALVKVGDWDDCYAISTEAIERAKYKAEDEASDADIAAINAALEDEDEDEAEDDAGAKPAIEAGQTQNLTDRAQAKRAAELKAAKPQDDIFPDDAQPLKLAEPDKTPEAEPTESKGHNCDPLTDPDLAIKKNPTMDETREFLRGLNLSIWDRGLGLRSWYVGEILNAFLNSMHYKWGSYKKVRADVGIGKTVALNCRHVSENFTRNEAKTLGYSEMLSKMRHDRGIDPDADPANGGGVDPEGVGVNMPDPIDPEAEAEATGGKTVPPKTPTENPLNDDNLIKSLGKAFQTIHHVETLPASNLPSGEAIKLLTQARKKLGAIERKAKAAWIEIDRRIKKLGGK